MKAEHPEKAGADRDQYPGDHLPRPRLDPGHPPFKPFDVSIDGLVLGFDLGARNSVANIEMHWASRASAVSCIAFCRSTMRARST
ncbi:hypothetical protein [Methylorubrum sp. POS3]|uniref:hypothetical protein n=1 Tax=Methylorubrum sp. POS3 TaxID=2998492 RepID=UPI00372D4099